MDRIERWRPGVSDRREPDRKIERGSIVCLPSLPYEEAPAPRQRFMAPLSRNRAGRPPPATTMHRSGMPEAVGVHRASEDSDELREQLQRAVFPRYRVSVLRSPAGQRSTPAIRPVVLSRGMRTGMQPSPLNAARYIHAA